MPERIPQFRIFLSSPGDVPAERQIALDVIEQIQHEPHLRGKVSLYPLAWDKPGAGTVMRATIPPQEAIDRGLTRPADCDIVIVIFWARMGTPLQNPPYHKANGEIYCSGAEWEYEDAVRSAQQHKRPEVVVYRRVEKVLLDPDAPDFKSKLEQYERVKCFFTQFRDPRTEVNLGGWNEYEKPEDFRKKFTGDLKILIEELLNKPMASERPEPPQAPKFWPGSPFPGLRAFTDKDAPIFFGRGGEIDKLTERVNDNRFVTVVGASGSGKSSLVWAGLIPRLEANGIRGDHTASGDWLWLRLTPGGVNDNPFVALAVELKEHLPGLEAREIAQKLKSDPNALTQLIPQILRGKPDSSELLLFIDQLEELATVVRADYRAPFTEMLRQAVVGGRFRAVATLRADFYHQMILIGDALVQLLQNGSYPLRAPDPLSLQEMIVRPAQLADLKFEDGLARNILDESGSDPGALALTAYLLDELYRRRTAEGCLTLQAYRDLGGVAGAIGKRAGQVFGTLTPAAQKLLPHVFRHLVEVDEHGTATRKRALREEIARSRPAEPTEQLLTAFTEARLLVTDKQGEKPTVEVGHEALLRKWDRLADWIEQKQDDLRLLRQVKLAAAEWDHNKRQDAFRWADERLKLVYAMIVRLELDTQNDFSAIEREFIRREFDRLLEVIEDADTPHVRRSWIGERLCEIGDTRRGVGLRPDGLPDINWCKLEFEGQSSVEVEIEDKVGKVKVDLPFYIARYPVTYCQFQAFIEAPDGYHNRERNWFAGLAADDGDKQVSEQHFKFSNHPRETVNWYQAMAFCRWLSWRFDTLKDSSSSSGMKASSFMNSSTRMPRSRPGKAWGFDSLNPSVWAVRLPTEAEWQLAAAGLSAKTYPWGNNWDARFANTTESGLSRTTAVGMYPAGAATCEALDMSGNVWEWTLTDHKSGKSTDITGNTPRVVRGGSWGFNQRGARAAYRVSGSPAYRDDGGFRVGRVIPSP